MQLPQQQPLALTRLLLQAAAAAEEAAVGDEETTGCNSASPACSEATETTAVMVAATGWRRRIC